MCIIKKIVPYVFLYCFILLCLILFGYNNTDNIWNFGMAFAIRNGEIPYVDFNIITTPLYAFCMSLFLLFKKSYFLFLMGQSFLCVCFFSLIYKMIGKKIVFLIPIIFLSSCYMIFPNYNFLVTFFILLLIYYDSKNGNDYWIGFLLGLLFLTKHTIGFVFIVFSLISTFSTSKSWKRVLGCIVPLFFFFFYLVFTNSLSSFINLSIMGLFDFGHDNGGVLYFFLILSFFIFLYTIYHFYKEPKNKNNYYLFASISFVFPICDFFHFNYLLLIFFVLFLSRKDFVLKKYYYISYIFVLFFFILNIRNNIDTYRSFSFSSLPHFEGLVVTRELDSYLRMVKSQYQKRKNSVMISMSNMIFDVSLDHKITYFDIPLYGNFGYHGVDSMILKIEDMHDTYFYIQDSHNVQFCIELNQYIRKHYELIDKIEGYEIYYKK